MAPSLLNVPSSERILREESRVLPDDLHKGDKSLYS